MSFLFVVAASGTEGCVLSSFCVVFFFKLFFPRGGSYFILNVSGVRDSYISFEGGCKGLAVNKNHYLLLYISQLYFY